MRAQTKRRLATMVAVAWAALLIPLGVVASGLWQAPISDAVSVVDQVVTNVLHLFRTPETDSATIGDQVNVTFILQATTTTLQANVNPIAYGSSLALTATVGASTANPGPGDGTVTFKDGGTTLCNGQALTGNQATCVTSQLTAGSHALSASYSGTSRFSGSTGSLTEQINPAPLTITADDKTKVYGALNPSFTVSYVGFVNGDTPASLGGTLAFAAPAPSSPAGTYPGQIVPSGLTSSNYALAFVNGTLTITPAPLTITANNAAKVYGAANPAFGVSYAGFVNGDGPGSLAGTLTFTTPPASSGAGTYAGQIVPSGLTSSNYAISYVTGTLTISPAPLTVTANEAMRFYGQPNPTFSISATGLVNGDTQQVLGTPSFSTSAIRTSPVGAYPIVPSGLANPNYSYTYVNGTLTIQPAPTATTLTATPNPAIVNRALTLTATVTTTAQNGSNPNSVGTVSFNFGSTLLGSTSLDANGVASLTATTLPVGHDSLTASYSGTTNYLGSVSGSVVEQVLQNRIVFSSNRDGNFEIYRMNPDGTNQTRLTNNPAVDTNPAVSPDSTKIAFVSTRSGSPQIWVMNADGSNPRQLTTGSCLAATPAWSPDGTKIAYTSVGSGSVQIWIIATDGVYPNTTPSQLTPDTFAVADTTPSWSPDGTRIAFTSTHSGLPQIWVMNADGSGTPTQLTPNTFALADTMPAWSPDGTQIAFASSKPGVLAVYLMSSNGNNPTRLTNDGLASDATPSWSTDGQQLAFTTTIGGIVEIYVINVDGTGLTQLTSGPAVNALPSWSTPVAP